MLLWTLLLACPKKPDLPPEDPGKPILAAPVAALYAPVPNAKLRDPLVAWVGRALPVDETLSGAAAGLGLLTLEDPGLDTARMRWAGIRAGWPYPIEAVSTELVAEGEIPESLDIGLREGLRPGQAVGLARVRGPQGDLWVVLASSPSVVLAPFAREQELGAAFGLSVTDAAGWTDLSLRGLSPSLQVRSGPTLSLDEVGEWVIELSGQDPAGRRRVAVQVPLYVGQKTPEDGPFLNTDSPPTDAPQAIRSMLADLNELRSTVDADPVETDPLIAAVARAEANRLAQGGAPNNDAEKRLRAVTSPDGPVAEVSCRAATIHGCLDGWFFSVDSRRAILDPRFTLVGVGAELVDGQALMVVDFAAR